MPRASNPEQMYQAATILQHGSKGEHYELAYLLANKRARWDTGKPMDYGKPPITAGCYPWVNHKSMERNPPQP